ncbi:MAG: branched-chain amino acid ABC transporter substrate-binding protein [Janthinobacterium lividum]
MPLRWIHAVPVVTVLLLAGCGKKDAGTTDTAQAASGTVAGSAPVASSEAAGLVSGSGAPDTTSAPSLTAAGSATPVTSDAAAVRTVRIGHAAPLSGDEAHLGQDSENAARLAVEEINTRGLSIDGQAITLELDAQDDGGDPRKGVALARKLVADHVVGVIGDLSSAVSIPASKIYSAAGVVQLSPASTDPAFTGQGYKTSYRMVANDTQQGAALAAVAIDSLHAKTMAVVDDGTPYGKHLAAAFLQAVRAHAGGANLHDIARESESGDKSGGGAHGADLTAILKRLKARAPNVILFAGMDVAGGAFVRQAAASGLHATVLGGDGLCSEKGAALAGAAVDNLICAQVGPALSNMDQGAAFAQRYAARFHVPVQAVAPFAYDAVYVLVDAMKRANAVDPAKILAAMPSTDYTGLTGSIAFTASGELKQAAVTLYQFKDQKRTVRDVVKM